MLTDQPGHQQGLRNVPITLLSSDRAGGKKADWEMKHLYLYMGIYMFFYYLFIECVDQSSFICSCWWQKADWDLKYWGAEEVEGASIGINWSNKQASRIQFDLLLLSENRVKYERFY